MRFWRLELDYDHLPREDVDEDAKRLVQEFPELGSIPLKVLDPNWIVGFVDGEGFFSVCIFLTLHKQRKNRQVSVNQVFGVAQKEYDALLKIKNFFGVGGIYRVKKKDGRRYWSYRIGCHNELKLIVDFFDRHPLQTQKQRDFEIWTRVWEIIHRKEHFKDEGIIKVAELRSQINVRGEKRRQFHSVDEIKNWLKAFPKKRNDFDVYEDLVIKQNLKRTDLEVAEMLNRRVSSISHRRLRLGSRKYKARLLI